MLRMTLSNVPRPIIFVTVNCLLIDWKSCTNGEFANTNNVVHIRTCKAIMEPSYPFPNINKIISGARIDVPIRMGIPRIIIKSKYFQTILLRVLGDVRWKNLHIR